MPSSFAGVCASTVTWLLSGGSLTFHHPFDAETLKRQLIDEACETLIVPAPLALRLGEAGAFADAAPSLQQVIGLWRTAEQVASSNTWNGPARFSDLYAFGEAGLFALPRDADGGAARCCRDRHYGETGPRPPQRAKRLSPRKERWGCAGQ